MTGIPAFQERATMKPFSLALCMALTAAALAQPSAARPPIVPGGETRQLTEHTYAIEDKDTTPGVPNIGFVVGTRGVLVIDTGMGPRNGRTVLAEAEKLAAGKQIYLVTTHVHPEHDLGAEAFPATTKMIRSADQEEDIRRHGYDLTKVFIARSPVNAELLNGAKFRTSDIHFDKEYTLELGGVTVRIFATGPDHTLGDTAIWVPSERVLFSGDVAMRGLPSFIPPDSSLQHWLLSLEEFAALKPIVVVPSHGPVGDASYISNYQALLTTIRDRAAALKQQGQTVDQVVATLSAELVPQYKDTNRLGGAIRTAYAEAP